jgi:tetratricopeptide (TPR) repeat protein
MPIRISRCLLRVGLLATSLSLGACSPAVGVRSDAPPGPVTPESLLVDADAALQRGDYPVAARLLREAAQASADETVAEQATRVAFDNFQLQEAVLASRRWLELNPTSEQARRYAGITALKLHRLDDAESHFADLVETAYISPAAGFLALLPVVSGEASATDVMELFRRLSARHPQSAEGHYAFGSAALRADNFALAERAAATAVERAPYWKPAKMLLARAKIARGQEEEGLASARELVVEPESDLATHLEYAMLLAATGRDEEARAMLTPYATGKTVVPGAVRALGVLDLDSGNLDAGNARFEELLSTGTQSYEALYYLGVIAERRKDTERALRFYARVTGGDYALPAQQRVARLKAEQSGAQAGLDHLDELARSQPQYGPGVVAAKAGLLSSLGDEKQALKVLDAGLARYPDVMELRMDRVFLYERTGREETATRELRAMLADRPGDATLQNALGYTLADRNLRLDEAETLLNAALAQTPDNAAVLDSMGWLLHRQGKHAEALKYLERARRLGSDPEIDLHVGEVQWAMGDRAAARKTWQDALEGRPDNERLRKRLERAGP